MKHTALIRRILSLCLAAALVCTTALPVMPVWAEEAQAAQAVSSAAQTQEEGQESGQDNAQEPDVEDNVQEPAPAGESDAEEPEAGNLADEPEPAAAPDVPAQLSVPVQLSAPVLLDSGEDKTPDAVRTGTSGVNLVNNPGFEAQTTTESWGSVNVQEKTEGAHSGAKCLSVAAGQTDVAFAFSGINASYDRSAAVTAGMWVRLTDASDAAKVSIVLERKTAAGDGAYNLVVQPQKTTEWQKVELTGSAMDAACTEHVIKFEVRSGSAGEVLFDDAYVYTTAEQSIQWLRNAGFEEGSNAWSEDLTVDGGRNGKSFSLPDGKNIYQATGWWGSGAPAYDGSFAKQFSVWAKSDNGAALTLRAELKDGKGDHSKQFPLTSEWQQYVLDIPATEGVTEALFYITASGGAALVDDAALTLPQKQPDQRPAPLPSTENKDEGTVVTGQEGENLAPNPGFEEESEADGHGVRWGGVTANSNTDYTHSGAWSAEFAPNSGGGIWNVLPDTVDANAAVTLSAWVYLEYPEDASKVHLGMERQYGNGQASTLYRAEIKNAAACWQKVELSVPECDAGNAAHLVIKVDADADAGAKGYVYVDDFFGGVEKSAEPERPAPIPSGESKTAGTVVTGQTGENLAQNPGFEEESEADGHGVRWGGVTVNSNTDYTHSGAYSAEFANGGSIWNVLPDTQDANAATVLSAWVYLEYPEDAGRVHLRLKRIDGDGKDLVIYSETVQNAAPGWQKVELTVPERTPQDAAQLVIVFDVDAGTKGFVYADDFFVRRCDKTPVYTDGYLTNPGLERVNDAKTEVNNWGLMPGWDTVADAVSTQAHSGSYAVRIPQADVQRELLQSTNWIDPSTTKQVDPSVPMLLSVWVKYENVTGDGIRLFSERKADGKSVVVESDPLTGTSDGWQRIELYIPPDEGAFDECLVGLRVPAGSGVVFADDFDLIETAYREPTPEDTKGQTLDAVHVSEALAAQDGANWLSNPGFEQDMLDWGSIGGVFIRTNEVHSGEKAAMLIGLPHIWNNVSLDVDKNLSFRLSFWVKFTAASDAKYLDFFVDRKDANDELICRYRAQAEARTGWQKVIIDIPAEEYFDTASLVIGADALSMLDPVYVDDFRLTKTTRNEYADNYIANWSYELKDGGREKWGAIPDWGNGLSVVSGEGHNRTNALRIDLDPATTRTVFQSNSWGGAQKYHADANMILSVYVRTTTGVTGDGLLLKAERKCGEDLVGEPILGERLTGRWDGWQLMELYIPATSEKVDDIIVTLEAAPGTGVVFADTWILSETNRPAPAGAKTGEADEETDGALLKNGGVEQLNPDGTVTHWDVWPGNPEEGERRSYSTTDIKHGGERAVCIELVYSNSQAIYQYRLPDDNPFPFNEDYIFSAWVKMDAVSVVDGNGVKIGVKRRGADGNEYNVYASVPIGTSDWTKIELEAPKVPGVEIVQYDVIFDIGCGSGKIYFDDFELTSANLEQPKETLTFQEVEPSAEAFESLENPDAGRASGGMSGTAILAVAGGCAAAVAVAGGALVLLRRKR